MGSRTEGLPSIKKGISILLPMRDEKLLARSKIEEVVSEIKNSTQEEIIVLDSGSVDGTGEIARKTLQDSDLPNDKWEVITLDIPGKTRAVNIGIKKANYSIIVMMDTDAICTPGWLSACYEIFTDSEIGLACGIENFDGYDNLSSSELTYKSYLNRRRIKQSLQSSIVIAEGSMCCFRRSCLEQNPLDERYNADDTQIALICSRHNLRSIMSHSLEFRDNHEISRKGNFWRRVRRGMGITNALTRNLDLAFKKNNKINPKEFIKAASLYLLAPWFPVASLLFLAFANLQIQDLALYPEKETLAISMLLVSIIALSTKHIRSYLEGCLVMLIAHVLSLIGLRKKAWVTDRLGKENG